MTFRLTEGTVHYVDMDLNVPSVSASNGQEYKGDTNDYVQFLMRTRPVLWREEISKLENMQNIFKLIVLKCLSLSMFTFSFVLFFCKYFILLLVLKI